MLNTSRPVVVPNSIESQSAREKRRINEKNEKMKMCNCVECSIYIVMACTGAPTNCAIILWNSYSLSHSLSHATHPADRPEYATI